MAPLVVLATLVATGVMLRLRAHRAAPRVVASGVAIGVAAAPGLPPLRGALPGPPSLPGLVDAHAARTLHGDARRTHRAHGRGPRTAHLAWSVPVGGPVAAQVATSPDEATLYVATLGGALIALARDGQVRWSLPLGDRVYASPSVADDGTLYVGSDAKKFFAVSPDGKVRWQLETKGDADTGALLVPAEPPAYPSPLVVFAAGRTVYAVRPAGDLAWRFLAKGKVFTAPALWSPRPAAEPAAAPQATAAPAAASAPLVIVGSQDHHVYALTLRGALAWSTDLGADVDGAPTLGDDGAIFVGTDAGDVVRLTGSGSVVYRAPLGGFVRGPLALARNGDVLTGVYGPTPREVRLAAATGEVLGSFAVQGTGAREFGIHGGALEDDDGTLYFGTQGDDVYGIPREGPSAAPPFHFVTGGDVDAPVTLLSSGELVVGSDDGKVYFFAADGS